MESLVYAPNQRFLDPDRILFQTGLKVGQTVADLGAGNGFYAFPAAKIVGDNGTVFVVDILESTLVHVSSQARVQNLRNIQTLRCDLEQPESCSIIPTGSADLAILANITHEVKDKKTLYRETYRILKTNGRVLVVEWNDQPSPIGPGVRERISRETVLQIASEHAFKLDREIETDRYHYGLLLIK